VNGWEIAGMVVLCIFYAIGMAHTADFVMERGMSMDDYREKFGNDLGLLLCIWYRSLAISFWPIMSGLRFGVGVVKDTYRLVFHKKTVKDTNDGE